MPGGSERGRIDDVEKGIRSFHKAVTAEYERLAPAGAMDIAERRRIAEIVRKPWSGGGPPMVETLDLRVGKLNVPIRVHRPVADPTLPVLIYLHGGGWMLFSLDTHDRLLREYAARAQVTVVGVDYSLAPEAQFPAPLEEIASVVSWLRSTDSTACLAPQKIVIGGDSAGANLALGTNLALRDANQRMFDGILLNYGAFDCSRRQSHDRFGGPEYMLTSDEMDEFWANYLPRDQCDDPLARPLLADLRGLPPTFMCIAECDILADENDEMERRLRQAGVAVTAHSYEGATHSFLEAVSVSALADRALQDASDWLSALVRQ